ncbi:MULTISPECIES: EamA family transporter [unclassified Janthinobacterium]|uniref:EamA family transporter n=1 Tax=unclassified Janthinobacterium TaxID=2610881 RepID=UPI00161A7CCC|nr:MULTISPECIES: EamA family transporter [unclassified Janthinobacterium]MBB5368393.1 inner membrane transporter RhtA [Janthinobacterium sp. K2C7]MBB5382071.1 inner membrane transporter RhtA [Janthinobacterium sp. K2Li3]MBB5386775.1 inner membrane transporter RhtA [Janthinobacterium sp. K2E3]
MTSTTTTSPVPDSFLLPSLAVLGGQISVNLGAAMAKHLFPVIGVEGITAYRVGFSALILLAIVRPWRFRLERKDVVNLLVYGSVLGLMNLLIYRAFALIPIGIAVAIEVTGPLTVAMLSSRRPRDLLAVACAVFGLYLLLPLQGGAGGLNPVGVAYALGAALCWALYIVFGKRASSLQGGQAVAWGMTVAAVLMVPLGVSYAGTALLAPSIALMGLAIAMLSSALPYSLEIFALRRLPQGVFGMFSSAAPAISALAAMLVLGEHLSLIQWLAIACIVFASAMAALGAQGAKR